MQSPPLPHTVGRAQVATSRRLLLWRDGGGGCGAPVRMRVRGGPGRGGGVEVRVRGEGGDNVLGLSGAARILVFCTVQARGEQGGVEQQAVAATWATGGRLGEAVVIDEGPGETVRVGPGRLVGGAGAGSMSAGRAWVAGAERIAGCKVGERSEAEADEIVGRAGGWKRRVRRAVR